MEFISRKVYLATFSTNAFKVINKYGCGIEYNQFCISSALDDDKVEKTMGAMKKEAVNCGLADDNGDIVPSEAMVHGPFTEIIPEAIDKMAIDMAMTRLDQAYAAMRRLGLDRLVVHSGYIPFMYFKEWHASQSIRFWTDFMENKDEGFHLYIENVLDDEPQNLIDIVKGIDDPRVQLCLDIGHANAMTLPEYTVYDWIERMGPHLGHFHFHNNDGTGDQHRPIMEGTLDMERILGTIDDFCSDEATITVESRDCDESVRWLQEKLK